MSRLRVHAKAPSPEALDLALEPFEPAASDGEVIVEIRAAGVNPSDVKAALGAMPHAVWPRTPGRDWAGVIVAGPDALRGRDAFGSGGDLGITRDGSHASHLVLRADAICLKPEALSLAEAGSLGVPFVTAQEGFQRTGMPVAGDVVLVLGANGKVGQAATQIATMLGSRVFGVARGPDLYAGHASAPVRMIDASREDIAGVVRAETDGHGADIVFNTVGSPYFEAACKAMALGARQVFISTLERAVPFDIFAFYRGRHGFFGVDTLALDATASAAILAGLAPGFASGALKPFVVGETFPLDRAREAYLAVLKGAKQRVVLAP
jgi:NADPH:quinone reductase-like Zn-dependent oxidoreductase